MKPARGLTVLVAITLVLSSGTLVAKAALTHPQVCSGFAGPPAARDALGDRAVTLAYAREQVPFAIPTPDHELANDRLIRRVWLSSYLNDERVPERVFFVLIDYHSGVTILYLLATREELEDTRGWYHRIVGEGHRMSVETVSGRPALVKAMDSGPCDDPPASLMTVVGNIRIQVVGRYAPVYPVGGTDVVRDVAASIGGDA